LCASYVKRENTLGEGGSAFPSRMAHQKLLFIGKT
ncbi:hypothetical protein D3OALGA1CA_5211, partial [Olavius algarvensis associated proteobacterium Delta 3]